VDSAVSVNIIQTVSNFVCSIWTTCWNGGSSRCHSWIRSSL